MKRRRNSIALAVLATAICMGVLSAKAQSPRVQAEKELARPSPAGTVQACSLITRADVKNATGRDPLVDPEPSGQGGWICNVGIGELKVYAGPKSREAWEATLKAFKRDKEPQIPATTFGDRAYFIDPKPDSKDQGNVAFLVASKANYTLALSLDAPEGKPSASMRPALESLMKGILTRLPQ